MKVWCHKWPDGCRRCKTKKREHSGQGYCSRCYHVMRRRGLQPSRHEARIRVRNGETQFFCHDCSAWKSTDHFDLNKQRTLCRECRLAVRKARYDRDKDRLNAARRDKAAREAELRRQNDIRRASGRDPWGYKPIVPIELVRSWLHRLLSLYDGSIQQVGFQVGLSDKRVRNLLYEVDQDMVRVDVAEKVARAADAGDELNAALPTGVEGWSPHSTHCLRCGTYELPHQAKGYCKRCYQNVRYHRQFGREAPLPSAERWARWYHACVRCGRSDYKHQGKGVCTGCYQQVRKERASCR